MRPWPMTRCPGEVAKRDLRRSLGVDLGVVFCWQGGGWGGEERGGGGVLFSSPVPSRVVPLLLASSRNQQPWDSPQALT